MRRVILLSAVACSSPGVDPPPDGRQEDACALVLLYPDGDGDGYGTEPAGVACVGSPGAPVGGDCRDADPLAHPGAGFRSVEAIGGGWDHNCDGTEEPEIAVWGPPCQDRSAGACPTPFDAWESAVPGCGVEARWVESCRLTANGCRPDVYFPRVQACR